MIPRPPRSTLTYTLCPYASLFRSHLADKWGGSDSEVIYYGSVDTTCLYARLIARFCATYGPQILEQQLLNLRSGQSKSVRQCLRSEEHTSELQSLMRISYGVFCLKKHNNQL